MSSKFTPEKIVKDNIEFSIPIYQRLFEWNSDNIETLLDDLYHCFTTTPDEPYYIGLLTDTAMHELVDGQQRFTVLTLIGIVCSHMFPQSGWCRFVKTSEPRLKFSSRPKDFGYLRQAIEDWKIPAEGRYVNRKMQLAMETISRYMESLTNAEGFSDYIFKNTTFFISTLPENYSPIHLNKYFERMNSAGKNLEQHEILKVKLLKNLAGDVSNLMRLWNRISELDTPLLRKRNDEDEAALLDRRVKVLQYTLDTVLSENLVNGVGHHNNDSSAKRNLKDIPISDKAPRGKRERIRESDSIVSFPMMLLLTLFWMIKENSSDETERISIKDFFNTGNLLSTFSKYIPYEGSNVSVEIIKDFIQRLLRVRVILDYCFIRSADYGYTLEMVSSKSSEASPLLMLESMLFVSSSKFTHYKWFGWLMRATENANIIPSEEQLYKALKAADDNENRWDKHPALQYPGDIRYWFWRLDFYLWLHREEIFRDYPEVKSVVENYRFVRNRSIEHVAPQHPVAESTLQWTDSFEDQQLMNSFGNLVMISNGLNSALKNQPYEVKKAHVQAYVQGSLNGSIESLSLLLLNSKYKKWDKSTIKEYGELTIQFLKDSY